MSIYKDRTILSEKKTYLKNTLQKLIPNLEKSLPVYFVQMKVFCEDLFHYRVILAADLLLHLVDKAALLAYVGMDRNRILAFLVPAQLLAALAFLESLAFFHFI